MSAKITALSFFITFISLSYYTKIYSTKLNINYNCDYNCPVPKLWKKGFNILLSSMIQTFKNSIVFLILNKFPGWDFLKIRMSFSSAQFSRSVVSDSLRPHELQHARPPCPSPTPGVYPNSCASSWWFYPAISSSVIPFCSCPQSLPASGSFPVSQLFTSGGQSIGVSDSASDLSMNIQDWYL